MLGFFEISETGISHVSSDILMKRTGILTWWLNIFIVREIFGSYLLVLWPGR
jgi:hypothetical protein